jgi:hypothetical protein
LSLCRDGGLSKAAPEGGEGSVGVAGVAAQHGGVAQGRHDAGSGAGADPAGVPTEGDIAKVVERLDRRVPAQQVGEPGAGAKAEDNETLVNIEVVRTTTGTGWHSGAWARST